MFKPSFAKVLIAGVLLGAGSAQAFPKAAEEVPGAWYAHTIQTAPVDPASVSRATFPVSVAENGSSHETYVEVHPSRIGERLMGALRAMFPAISNETTPLNL